MLLFLILIIILIFLIILIFKYNSLDRLNTKNFNYALKLYEENCQLKKRIKK